jgi:hypothetical protein
MTPAVSEEMVLNALLAFEDCQRIDATNKAKAMRAALSAALPLPTMPPLTDRMLHAAGVARRGLHGEEEIQAIHAAFAEFAPATRPSAVAVKALTAFIDAVQDDDYRHFVDGKSGALIVARDNLSALSTLAPSAAPSDEDTWRNLALQFDGHRIEALALLRYVADEAAAELPQLAGEVKQFLSAPPLSGEKVLAERIAALASPSAEAAQPVAWDVCNVDGEVVRTYRAEAHAKAHLADVSMPRVIKPLFYLSQPQGELREAGVAFLNEVESVSGKVNKRHRDAFRAALAGRTAG